MNDARRPADTAFSPNAGTGHETHSFRGTLLFLLGVFLFSCMDSTTKYLVSHYEVPLVVAIRYIVNCLLMVALLAPTQGRALVRTQRTGLVVVRACCLVGASLAIGLAFQRLPIAEATSIVFLAPLVVTLLAGPVLGERVGVLGWIAALLGFSGVLLVVHPGGALDVAGVGFALCAALLSAGYQMLSRVLASTEQTVPMLFYTTLVGAGVFGAYLPWSWGGPAPTPLQLLLFFGTGAMGGLGHYLFTAAHRNAPASLLAPMMYVQLLWSGLIGWGLFGHVPAPISIVGMAVVAAAGILIAFRSRFARRVMADPLE